MSFLDRRFVVSSLMAICLLIPKVVLAQWVVNGNNINNTNSGNVGVGTSTPQNPLEVFGNGQLYGNYRATALFQGNNSLGAAGLAFFNGGAAGVGNQVAFQALLNRIAGGQSSGGVIVWTEQDAGNTTFSTDLSLQTAVNNVVASRIYVDKTGNVGVGTTTPAQRLEVNGSVKLTTGSGGAIIFQDGTTQSTAQLVGPQGPQGPAGPTGPQGPQGPQGPPGPQLATTFRAFCAGSFLAGDAVVLNFAAQNYGPFCSLTYRGLTVLYQAEFGNGGQTGNNTIYTDAPTNSKVDTQFGLAMPRNGTLSNLRVSAITGPSALTSGRVLVRKIRTDNSVDNTSGDVLLTCTLAVNATSCSDTTHTLSINAGERMLITAYTASGETTLTSLSVLVDLN